MVIYIEMKAILAEAETEPERVIDIEMKAIMAEIQILILEKMTDMMLKQRSKNELE